MLTGAVWTFDHVVGIAGLLVGVVAAVGGCVAAIYGIRGLQAQRDAARAEAERWRRDIRPKVDVKVSRPVDVDQELVAADITNAGGAAQVGFVVYSYSGNLYGGRFQVGAHGATRISLKLAQSVTGMARTGVILLVARDVESTWWDMSEGNVLADGPNDLTDEPFGEWAIRRAIWIMRRDAGLPAEPTLG